MVNLPDALPHRAIIPLIPPSHAPPTGEPPSGEVLPQDLFDIQGDIIYLFPKKAENFLLFRITDRGKFKTALKTFKPSSSLDTIEFIKDLAERKVNAPLHDGKIELVPKTHLQIAFSRMGMYKMGIKDDTGDVRFDKFAMRDDKAMLDDQSDWDGVFEKARFDPVNGSVHDDAGALHGVITVAGSDPSTCASKSDEVKKHFEGSIDVKHTMEGRTRPGDQAGHEHFGYKDGVSQPALRGLMHKWPGQIEVNPGVIVLGYKGDPLIDYPDSEKKRPPWAKGGSMMVFRKLEQDVPEFNAYLTKNGKNWKDFAPPGCPQLTDKEGADLWGARMIGRWKSGAPLATNPYKDNLKEAADRNKNNHFDYAVRGVPGVSPREPSDYYCPFAAHTRKTAPRNLDPYISRDFLAEGMIVRAGIPYGSEVTEKPKDKRGLLFISYQSSLDQGFVRQSRLYGGNDYFPTTSLVPTKHGQDPIIGGPPPKGSARYPNTVAYTGEPTVVPQPGKQLDLEVDYKGNPLGVSGIPSAAPPPHANKVVFAGKPIVKPKPGDQVNLTINYERETIKVSGWTRVKPKYDVEQEFFVTSRGGEYFFVPPISTLKLWAYGN